MTSSAVLIFFLQFLGYGMWNKKKTKPTKKKKGEPMNLEGFVRFQYIEAVLGENHFKGQKLNWERDKTKLA